MWCCDGHISAGTPWVPGSTPFSAESLISAFETDQSTADLKMSSPQGLWWSSNTADLYSHMHRHWLYICHGCQRRGAKGTEEDGRGRKGRPDSTGEGQCPVGCLNSKLFHSGSLTWKWTMGLQKWLSSTIHFHVCESKWHCHRQWNKPIYQCLQARSRPVWPLGVCVHCNCQRKFS